MFLRCNTARLPGLVVSTERRLWAELGRTRAVEGELAEARTRAAVAEALLEVERAVGRELRAELARLRLPFWRRWLG